MLRLPASTLAAAALLAVLLTACGGGSPSSASPAEQESAWLSLLQGQQLTPAGGEIRVRVSGGSPELTVLIAVPATAQRTYTFGDGLYGADAYTFSGGKWLRVDTADIRTEIAPVLSPGQSATVKLPVKAADSYRVLVKTDGLAAWGDTA